MTIPGESPDTGTDHDELAGDGRDSPHTRQAEAMAAVHHAGMLTPMLGVFSLNLG